MPLPHALGPASVNPGAGPSHLVLSPSSLATFTECEQRYAYDQALPRGEDGHRVKAVAKGAGLTLGVAVHTLLRVRWQGGDWRAAAAAAAVEASPNWTPAWNYPDVVQKAVRLVSRHEAAFPVLPTLIASEWQFRIPHPRDRALTLTGYQDGLTLVQAEDPEHAGLWALEVKTMSRWDRTDWLGADPQLWTYLWAARAQGFEVRGMLFEAILTTEWVEERPPEASFRRLWVPYSQGKVDAVLVDYERAAARIRTLDSVPPVRNAGRACGWCDHKVPCWKEAGGYDLAT